MNNKSFPIRNVVWLALLLFADYKILIIKTLARLCDGAGWIESYLVVTTKTHFLLMGGKHYK